MPSGAYIVTGGICGFIAVMSLLSGNIGGALLFGVGVAINTMLYRRRVDQDELEMLRWERNHPNG